MHSQTQGIRAGGKTSNAFLCLLNEEVVGWFFKWSEGGRRSEGPARKSGLRGLPSPLVVLCAGIMHGILLLFLAPQ